MLQVQITEKLRQEIIDTFNELYQMVEESNMKIRDLLEVLNTDSIVLARENDIPVDCETPYINQALREYMDEEIERITPLDNAMEIILK